MQVLHSQCLLEPPHHPGPNLKERMVQNTFWPEQHGCALFGSHCDGFPLLSGKEAPHLRSALHNGSFFFFFIIPLRREIALWIISKAAVTLMSRAIPNSGWAVKYRGCSRSSKFMTSAEITCGEIRACAFHASGSETLVGPKSVILNEDTSWFSPKVDEVLLPKHSLKKVWAQLSDLMPAIPNPTWTLAHAETAC